LIKFIKRTGIKLVYVITDVGNINLTLSNQASLIGSVCLHKIYKRHLFVVQLNPVLNNMFERLICVIFEILSLQPQTSSIKRIMYP